MRFVEVGLYDRTKELHEEFGRLLEKERRLEKFLHYFSMIFFLIAFCACVVILLMKIPASGADAILVAAILYYLSIMLGYVLKDNLASKKSKIDRELADAFSRMVDNLNDTVVNLTADAAINDLVADESKTISFVKTIH